MGNIQFYNEPSPIPTFTFTLADLDRFKGVFSEMVLNVSWAQLQLAEGSPLTTSVIDAAISEVASYNDLNGTDLGIKLRVWGGFTAPNGQEYQRASAHDRRQRHRQLGHFQPRDESVGSGPPITSMPGRACRIRLPPLR